MAVLDTGCGDHPWLDGVVKKGIQVNSVAIGYDDPSNDPELDGDVYGMLDGVIDPLAGHGTFIAGLILQGARTPTSSPSAWCLPRARSSSQTW